MFCADCGRLIADNARVCRYCGKPNAAANESQASAKNDTLYPPAWLSNENAANPPATPDEALTRDDEPDKPEEEGFVLNATALAPEYVQTVQDDDDSDDRPDHSSKKENDQKDGRAETPVADSDHGKNKKNKKKKTDEGGKEKKGDRKKDEKPEKEKSKKEKKAERKKEKRKEKKKNKKETEKDKERTKKEKKEKSAEPEADQNINRVKALTDDQPIAPAKTPAPVTAPKPVPVPVPTPVPAPVLPAETPAAKQPAAAPRPAIIPNSNIQPGFITSWAEPASPSGAAKVAPQKDQANTSAQADDPA